MTNRLGCDLSDLIAAIAAVAGGYPRTQECHATRPLPVVAFHGTADRLIPYEGSVLLLPVREWAAAWAAPNGCDPTPAVTFQHGDVTGETWSNCRDGAEVTLYTVEGGGHSWPGSDTMPPEITTQDIEATDAIWEFFAAHPFPALCWQGQIDVVEIMSVAVRWGTSCAERDPDQDPATPAFEHRYDLDDDCDIDVEDIATAAGYWRQQCPPPENLP